MCFPTLEFLPPDLSTVFDEITNNITGKNSITGLKNQNCKHLQFDENNIYPTY